VGNDGALPAPARPDFRPLTLVMVTYAVLAFRLFQTINAKSVNIFTWDQWDFNDPILFHPQTLWRSFLYQHGPHRQGLGALVGKMIGDLSHWNTRSEAFAIGVIVVIASLCALWLKTRYCGPVRYTDVVIPLMFFTPVQLETYLGATNPAHGSLPLLLIMLYCLAWTIGRDTLRYGIVLVVNFLATYTGFGLFLGLITPVLLALDAHKKMNRTPKIRAWPAIAAGILSLASIASFFVGYTASPAVGCFSFPDARPWRYLAFVSLLLGHFSWNRGYRSSLVAGGVVLVIFLAVWSVRLGRTLVRSKKQQDADLVIMALLSFSLLFAAGTAIGRVCLGVGAAQSSRYMIYLVPGFLGIFFHVVSGHGKLRRASMTAVLVLCLLAAFPRGFSAEWRPSNDALAWKNCYLRLENIGRCDALTNSRIYPAPESTRLREKLDYLKRQHLNLFAK
jgi:hypothetical protein